MGRDGDAVVYFVIAREVGRVKVGMAPAPSLRRHLTYLINGSPVKLEFLGGHRGGKAAFRSVLDRFRRHHVGGDWFDADEEVVGYVGRHADLTPAWVSDEIGWGRRPGSRGHRKPIAAPEPADTAAIRLDPEWAAILKAEYGRLKGVRDPSIREVAEWLLVKQARKWDRRLQRAEMTKSPFPRTRLNDAPACVREYKDP